MYKQDTTFPDLEYCTETDVEIAFVKEDVEIYRFLPLSWRHWSSSKRLNPVRGNYMGYLFPILLRLQHIYEQLSSSNGLKFSMPLASAILADSAL